MPKRTQPDDELLFSGSWLEIRRKENWEYMTRKRSHGVAVIVAVTRERELLLTEQYRQPLGASVLELPAGLVGDQPDLAHEPALDAAHRELLEETGYQANNMMQLAEGPVSSGSSNEELTFFYCDDIQRVGEGGGDETEDITVHRARLDQIEDYLTEARARGLLIDPKIYIGLYFAHRFAGRSAKQASKPSANAPQRAREEAER